MTGLVHHYKMLQKYEQKWFWIYIHCFAFQDTVTKKKKKKEQEQKYAYRCFALHGPFTEKGTEMRLFCVFFGFFFFFCVCVFFVCFVFCFLYTVFIQDTVTETGTEMGIVLQTRYSYRNWNIKFIMHCFAYKIQLQKQKRIVLHTRYSYRNRNRNGHCFCIQDTVTETGTETHCFAFQSTSYRNRNTDGYTGVVVCETTDPNIERSYNYTNIQVDRRLCA